jgi:phosphoglycolate phosphatase
VVELYIFDFDGTLCATHEAIAHCLLRTFDYYSEPQPAAAAITAAIRSGIGLAETFARLRNHGLQPHEADGWAATYREFYNSGDGQGRTYLFPGVEEALAHVRDSGGAIAVVSNKGEVSVRHALAHFGIARYVDLVVGDRPGIASKPNPGSYHQIIAPAFPGITPAETMIIGDTAADIVYARNIGAVACWACYGYGDAEWCSGLAPDIILEDIGDLKARVPLTPDGVSGSPNWARTDSR